SIAWTAVVADSGTLKSPAYQMGVGYLFRLQKTLIADHKLRCQEYEQEKQQYDAKLREDKKEGGDHPGDPPEVPTLRRVICSDVTIEKRAEILEDTARGTLTARDELAGWLGSFSRYKGKAGGSDLPAWLEFFRGGPVLVDRKSGERRHYFIER